MGDVIVKKYTVWPNVCGQQPCSHIFMNIWSVSAFQTLLSFHCWGNSPPFPVSAWQCSRAQSLRRCFFQFGVEEKNPEPQPHPTPLGWTGAGLYRQTSVLNFTNALVAEWEQIHAARFQNLAEGLPRRVEAVRAADYGLRFWNDISQSHNVQVFTYFWPLGVTWLSPTAGMTEIQ